MCDFSFLIEKQSCYSETHAESTVLVSSVKQNEQMYSRRQVARAKLARTLLRRLAFGPPAVISRMLNQGALIECPITSDDIVIADKIYGKLVPELRGKIVRRNGFDTITVEPGTPRTPMKLNMYTDIMFVNRKPFLLSVFAPINLTMVSDMGGSNALPNIRSSLETHLNLLEENGLFRLGDVHCDNEFDEEEVRLPIRARPEARMILCGPGQHVPEIERKIRVVKERVRAQLSDLPYNLPARLLPWLLYFVVYCLNCIPVRSSGFYVSPRELMTGRKLNYKRDLRFEFGSYIEARNPTGDSSMAGRTNGMIPLLSSGNVQGSVHCFSLETKRVVVRDSWTVLPMPDIVISMLNRLADVDKLEDRVTRDPEFRVRNQVIRLEADHNEQPDLDTNCSPQLDGVQSEPSIDARVEPPSDEDLKIRIPRDIWDAETNRKDLELVLDDGIVRDADGDIVMDTTDSIDYTTNGVPTTQYDKTYGALYVRPVPPLTPSKHTFRLTIKQCIQRNGEEKTIDELRREVQQMLTKHVWQPVLWDYLTDEERKSVITSSMFLKEKFAADGKFDKLKARLVAGGHQQDRSVYSDSETSSPTVSTTSLFLIAAIAAKENRKVVTIDFSGAYLNAQIKKKVLMKIDKILSSVVVELDPSYCNYIRKDGTLVLQQKKALYGCVESGKLWYDLLSTKLCELGFTANDYECCVFNNTSTDIRPLYAYM